MNFINTIFIFFIVSSITIVKGQESISFEMNFDSTLIGNDLCETAKNIAERDIEQGKFMTFLPKSEFSFTLQNLLLSKYNIYVFTNGTCTPDDFCICYKEKSHPIKCYIKNFAEIINEYLIFNSDI